MKREKGTKIKKAIAILSLGAMTLGTLTACSNDGKTSEGITVVSREDGSGTRDAFVELFEIVEKIDGEKVDMTTPNAQITNSTSVVITTVSNNESAIGYLSLGSLSDEVKALQIDGVDATAENVKMGTYKIARAFNIAVKDNMENEAAEDFMKFITSDDGQKIIEENGYIAIESTGAYETANASGEIVVGGSSSVAPVMEKLIEAYEAINSDVKIELQVTDSSTGMSDVAKGNYDIGMASREVKDTELEQGLVPTKIAMDGITVIVNKGNSVNNMTSAQVKGVYVGEILTWDEVK